MPHIPKLSPYVLPPRALKVPECEARDLRERTVMHFIIQGCSASHAIAEAVRVCKFVEEGK